VIAGVKISDSPNSASVTGFEGVVEIYSSLRACAAGSSPSSDHTGVFSGSEMVGIEKQHRSYGREHTRRKFAPTRTQVYWECRAIKRESDLNKGRTGRGPALVACCPQPVLRLQPDLTKRPIELRRTGRVVGKTLKAGSFVPYEIQQRFVVLGFDEGAPTEPVAPSCPFHSGSSVPFL
jgi:hypothetical protein